MTALRTRFYRWLADALVIWEGPPEDHDTLKPFADAAYDRYVEWFGVPPDAELPYSIRRNSKSARTYCHFNPKSQQYIIVISDQNKDPNRRRFSIAHEIYRRVTMRRSGMREELWIDEMMAQATAYRFMREQGYGDSVNRWMLRNMNALKQPVDPAALRTVVRNKENPSSYPDGFATAVNCLGFALLLLVKWEYQCRIVEAKSLEEWIAGMPAHVQYPVSYILATSRTGTQLEANTQVRMRCSPSAGMRRPAINCAPPSALSPATRSFTSCSASCWLNRAE